MRSDPIRRGTILAISELRSEFAMIFRARGPGPTSWPGVRPGLGDAAWGSCGRTRTCAGCGDHAGPAPLRLRAKPCQPLDRPDLDELRQQHAAPAVELVQGDQKRLPVCGRGRRPLPETHGRAARSFAGQRRLVPTDAEQVARIDRDTGKDRRVKRALGQPRREGRKTERAPTTDRTRAALHSKHDRRGTRADVDQGRAGRAGWRGSMTATPPIDELAPPASGHVAPQRLRPSKTGCHTRWM